MKWPLWFRSKTDRVHRSESYRPSLESLENRLVPSCIDYGPGTSDHPYYQPGLDTITRFNFASGRQAWAIYDYNGGQGDQNIFYDASWQATGGVNNSGYVWSDDCRWRVDTPEDPNSILPFLVYFAPVDLRNARVSVYLRGDGLDLKGGSVYFWVVGSTDYGFARWHYTARPLTVAQGRWGAQQSFVLEDDASRWHLSYLSLGLDDTLHNAISIGFSFVGFSEKVTGKFLMDDLVIQLSTPAGPALDPTFGSAGEFTTNFETAAARAVAVQTDGKLVVVGDSQSGTFALARFNADGTLDASFGDGGKVNTAFPQSGGAAGVCIQADGKIVAVGTINDPLSSFLTVALARYNADGTLDLSFGSGGLVTSSVTFGSLKGLTSVASQPDGKILVAGVTPGLTGAPVIVSRFNADGSLDDTFGNNGIVTTGFAFGGYVAVQPDGKILVAGTPQFSGSETLLRLNANGSPDSTFGNGGAAQGPTGPLVIQPDGRIVAGGLARVNVNGTLDTTFVAAGGSPPSIVGVGLLPNGRIVVGGTLNSKFFLRRYNPNGSLDTTFGGTGQVTTSFGDSTTDTLSAIVVQPDGKTVAVGTTALGDTSKFAVARYLTSDTITNANQRLVTQVYFDLLQRPADPSGLTAWTAFLNQGHTRAQMVQMFESSPEYRGLVVQRLYGQVLGRSADPSGLTIWVGFLGQGHTAEQLQRLLFGSTEYFLIAKGGKGNNDDFLKSLYRDALGREIDAGGLIAWSQQLTNGVSRTAIAAGILNSLESDRLEVQGLYAQWLRRKADDGGLNAFTNALQQGLSNEQILAALVGSDEYFARL